MIQIKYHSSNPLTNPMLPGQLGIVFSFAIKVRTFGCDHKVPRALRPSPMARTGTPMSRSRLNTSSTICTSPSVSGTRPCSMSVMCRSMVARSSSRRDTVYGSRPYCGPYTSSAPSSVASSASRAASSAVGVSDAAGEGGQNQGCRAAGKRVSVESFHKKTTRDS